MDPSLRGSICEEITFNYIIDYQGHTLPARSMQLLRPILTRIVSIFYLVF